MRSNRRRLSAIVLVFASLLVAAACVNVPTTGPIEKVEGQQPRHNSVNVQVEPPQSGDDPLRIVEGFLRATSNYQPNYSVARQFLTQSAADKWNPEAEVLIYTGSPKAVGTKVILDGQQVGLLGPDRTYTAHNQKLLHDFGLVEEQKDVWRISKPPPGLMVAKFWFDSFYQPYDLYFIGNESTLVPDPIYLPALSNPANVASALIKALLRGPSAWLKPAVSTKIPPNTSLSMDSVTITDGIAEVPLNDSIQALPDPQRSLLAAQIVYTLRQVSGVKGVLIKINQQPYRVPGSDPNSLVISVDAMQAMDPVPFGAGDQLYAVKEGLIKKVTATSDSPTLEDLRGPGRGLNQVNALAVSVTNTDLAVTTNNRTALRHVVVTSEDQPLSGEKKLLLSGKRELLRPQFTRYGEIWEIGKEGGRQRLWMFKAVDQNLEEVPIESTLVNGKVKAFKISPDGSRMALVRTTDGGGSELGLARIIRSDKIVVDKWQYLRTSQTNGSSIGSIRDVAWLNATELLVLGAAAGETAYAPFRISQDASENMTEMGSLQNANALQLAVSPRRQTAIIVDDKRRTWKYDGNQWSSFLKDQGISTLAYAG